MTVPAWFCAAHGLSTTGDCPQCDDELFAAIEGADAEARAEHDAGRCHLSEWSCSHCEAEGHLAGYFIAPDANDQPHIWRERGNHPVPVLARWDLRDDPEVWDILAAAIREQP